MKTVTITRNNGTTYETTQLWADNNKDLLAKNGQTVTEDKTEETVATTKPDSKALSEGKGK